MYIIEVHSGYHQHYDVPKFEQPEHPDSTESEPSFRSSSLTPGILLDQPVKPTKSRKFRCDQCSKAFVLKINLVIHMRTHSGEKPYSCHHCDRDFSQASALVNHIRTHTGEKPYCCMRCPKSFAQGSNLAMHMRTHTGYKPFSCNLCGKNFTQKSNMAVHLRAHKTRSRL